MSWAVGILIAVAKTIVGLAGPALIATGLASSQLTRPPDHLVSGDARLVVLCGLAGELWFDATNCAAFTR
jgi:hypothetical protein